MAVERVEICQDFVDFAFGQATVGSVPQTAMVSPHHYWLGNGEFQCSPCLGNFCFEIGRAHV